MDRETTGAAGSEYPEHTVAGSPDILSRAFLIGANLIPVVGVLFYGWNTMSVLFLYWWESGVVCFYTVLKMILLPPADDDPGRKKLGHISTFSFIATVAMLIHGLFLVVFSSVAGERDFTVTFVFLIAVLAFFMSHGVSFAQNFMLRHEYLHTDLMTIMAIPVSRLVTMQLVLILGGSVAILLRSLIGLVLPLIALKTLIDLAAHNHAHRKLAKQKRVADLADVAKMD